MLIRQRLVRIGFRTLCGLFFAIGGSQISAASFYEGKTLTVIQGRAPGGLGDTRVRVVTEYLERNLAGSPVIVFKYMPGAGGTVAANHMAKAVKRDGLTIANIGSAFIVNAIVGGRGTRYKLDDFVFLGAPTTSGPDALVVRPELGLDTVAKLKGYRGLRFAERSVGHSLYVQDRILAYVLELKNVKWVVGYSSPEINPAIENGEADARTDGLDNFFVSSRQWLQKGYSIPVLIKTAKGQGAELVPKFPQNVATLDQFADTELKRGVLRLFHSNPGGSIFLVAKGVPEEALRALRGAFDKIWRDPQFAKNYKRVAGEPANPVTGEEIERGILRIPRDPKVLNVYKQLMGPGALPPTK